MNSIKELASKKVGGVPVLYIVALVVAVLGIVAWRMKSTPEEPEESADSTQAEEEVPSSEEVATADYGFAATRGTVTVSGASLDTDTASVLDTNELWVRRGAEYLASQGYTATNGLTALTKYVEGQELSYEEGGMRDKAVAQLGLPPETITPGSTKDAPGKRVGNPPVTHTVKGSNDNTYTKLASLYYSRTDGFAIDLLQRDNVNRLGHEGPFPVGTTVKIPKWQSPVYATAKTGMTTLAQFAAKNSVTKTAVQEMNDGVKFPVKTGKKVRVA
jgi:hypothetical protein